MTHFDETQHPRGAAGKFTTKEMAEADGGVDADFKAGAAPLIRMNFTAPNRSIRVFEQWREDNPLTPWKPGK